MAANIYTHPKRQSTYLVVQQALHIYTLTDISQRHCQFTHHCHINATSACDCPGWWLTQHTQTTGGYWGYHHRQYYVLRLFAALLVWLPSLAVVSDLYEQ